MPNFPFNSPWPWLFPPCCWVELRWLFVVYMSYTRALSQISSSLFYVSTSPTGSYFHMKLHVIGPFRRPTVLLLFPKIAVIIECLVTGTGRLSMFSENNRPRRSLLATHVDQLSDGQTQQCVYLREDCHSFLLSLSSSSVHLLPSYLLSITR